MSTVVLLVILLFAAHSAVSIKFHIVSSLNDQCPGELVGEPCLTLQQYVTYPSQSTNNTLQLQPGNHTLSLASTFAISGTYFGLLASSNAVIDCSRQSITVSIRFSSVTQVDIKGITFIGCGTVEIYSATNVSIVRSSFLMMYGSYSLHLLSSSHVLIESCTLKNKTSGRLLYLSRYTTARVVRSTFSDSGGRNYDGGAMYVRASSSSSLLITESNFKNNTADRGGAVYYYSSYSQSYMTTEQCAFVDNRAYRYGGALYAERGSINNTGNTFINNTASFSGGALYLSGSNAVTNTRNKFINNKATYSYGGAVYVSSNSINNDNTFINNTAINGGAVCVWSNSINNNNTFINNTAANGGAVYASGPITNKGSNFTNNRASSNGGAVYASRAITNKGSNFTNNRASSNGGAVYMSGSYRIVTSGTNFINNRAITGRGGAMYMPSSGVAVTSYNSEFVNNVGYSGGGALYLGGSQASLTVSRSRFVNNLVTGPNGNGGAVNVARTSAQQIIIIDSIFVNNSVTNGSGGAIYTKQGFSMTDSIFGYNKAPLCAVLNVEPERSYSDHSVSLTTSTFLHNTATGSTLRGNIGGVGCIRNAVVSVLSSTFSHNSAVGVGGVFDIENSTISIVTSTFKNNMAGVDGGVFYTHVFPSNYVINESRFVNNRAGDDGGAIYLGRIGSSIELYRNLMTNNEAKDRGGAVAAFGSSVIMASTNVQRNKANLGGVISVCSSEQANNNIASLNGRTDLTHPVCTLYDGSIQGNPEPVTNDNSEFDTTIYFQAFINGQEASGTASTDDDSITTAYDDSITTAYVDPILKDIQHRLFGTSVIIYNLFALAIIFFIIAVALKFKRMLMRREQQQSPPTTTNTPNQYRCLADDPEKVCEESELDIKMQPNAVYTSQVVRCVKK